MTMSVGALCYATQSGLGHLAKQFYDSGVVTRFCEIPHPRYARHPEWYHHNDFYSIHQYKSFLEGLHALIIFENAFNHWGVVQEAKRRGIKFILIPMYEWTPVHLPVEPDLVICPSLEDVLFYHDKPHVSLTIPVPKLPQRVRTEARVFVHNAGHGQVGYTKGTPEVLTAMQDVKSPVKMIVRGQPDERRVVELLTVWKDRDPRIDIRLGQFPYNELFTEGDVYINAERYNGLSLPLQEAYASGMLVMTSNRFPHNTWLPNDPLIPVTSYDQFRVNPSGRLFPRALIELDEIAKTIEKWYGSNIKAYSQMGIQWGKDHSWERMKPLYIDVIKNS